MRWIPMLFALPLAGCTFGAPASSVAPVAAAAPVGGTTAAIVVDVDLTLHAPSPIDAGLAGGYAPATVRVAVGTLLRFTNSDGFAHTVTSLSGATFPVAEPFDAGALDTHGSRLSSGFSSGVLNAGATTQTILADAPGTYLYGCFFHYGAPMRGEIIVR